MPTSYPLHKIKVVLLEGVHPLAQEALEREGYTVHTHDEAQAGDELLAAAADAHVLGIRSKTQVGAEFLARASRLWAIGCFCIGVNQVDLAAAADRGVAVFNSPFANTRSVAELTIAQIIALHRRLFERSSMLHTGVWRKSASGANEVRGRTLGIVGYGRIGSQVSVLAEAIGMRVLFFDVVDRLPLGNAQIVRTLDDLLGRSDVVSLHVPATPATHGMFGAGQMAKMKPGAYLINNARGDVVDVAALAGAIRERRLGGAAVDVFPEEPDANDEPFASPLLGVPNVILSPHIAGSTVEAQRAIAEDVASKIARFMNVGSTSSCVNMPEVELPLLHPDKHRILHLHRNVPGVLSKMHRIIADLGVNIHSEYLQSNLKHGYVILDVDPTHDEAIAAGLRGVPETIRVRTLW